MTGAGLAESLAAAGIETTAAGPLVVYLQVLERWASRVNLTAAASATERVETLIAPVAPFAAMLKPGRLIDIGSGNGSPGLVLALLRPDLVVVLLEPRTKRWAFLREAARACGRSDIEVRNVRHDACAGTAENVTIRAVALPMAEIEPLVSVGGQLLIWGPAPSGRPVRITPQQRVDLAGYCIHRYE